MATFLTAYAMGGSTYGEYIEADGLGDAKAFAAMRGLNERVLYEAEGPALPNELTRLLADEKWLQASHAAAQLCFIGMSAGVLTARECLGDKGLVHELLHLAQHYTHHPDEDPKIVAQDKRERNELIRRVKAMARDFEWRVPGWPPSFTGKPGVNVRINDRRQPTNPPRDLPR